MIPKETRTRHEKLKAAIERHRKLYYEQDRPEISDTAYDELEQELLRIEQEYPELASPASPTQRVGGAPLAKFVKVRHAVPQWSFSDAFTPEDIREWDARVKRFLREDMGETSPSYVCE